MSLYRVGAACAEWKQGKKNWDVCFCQYIVYTVFADRLSFSFINLKYRSLQWVRPWWLVTVFPKRPGIFTEPMSSKAGFGIWRKWARLFDVWKPLNWIAVGAAVCVCVCVFLVIEDRCCYQSASLNYTVSTLSSHRRISMSPAAAAATTQWYY